LLLSNSKKSFQEVSENFEPPICQHFKVLSKRKLKGEFENIAVIKQNEFLLGSCKSAG